uniref:formate--tetrahydrofolate ligase n=1 Tax=Mesorhizobium silamurunense TaxID=499528 RepID=UPI001784D610
PVVVAINHFTTDTETEIQAMKDFVKAQGAEAILCKHWAQGSAGIEDLAKKVVEIAESGASQFSPLYPDEMPLFEKVNTIVKRIYRGDEAIADKSIRDQLHAWEQAGYGNLPVCPAQGAVLGKDLPQRTGSDRRFVLSIVRAENGQGRRAAAAPFFLGRFLFTPLWRSRPS